jgi:NAD(P)-dependent dehydrogenase (short-subunit alcohol dehydrogenase family)
MMTQHEGWNGAAVVTGAGSGLGAQMARRFAGAGLDVVAIDIDVARAEETAAALRADGARAIAFGIDVSDRAALQQAAQSASETIGDITVLAANVGVQQFGAVDKLGEAEWRWLLDVNVIGVANTVAAFLPALRKAQGMRRILLTASSAVLAPGERLGAYTASKFAVMGLGETLRMELERDGIGVSVLFPAGMATRHLESSQLAKPSRIEGPVMTNEDIQVMMASQAMLSDAQVASAEHATRNLLTELAANQRYIVTHGDYRDDLVERLDAMLAAYDRSRD